MDARRREDQAGITAGVVDDRWLRQNKARAKARSSTRMRMPTPSTCRSARRPGTAPPHDAPIEDYIKQLDAHGITHAVLAGASIYGDYNDYQIAATRKHKRLRGTVIINNPATDRYVLEMMKADGVVGVRFQRRNVANPPDLSSPEYKLLLRRIRDLDWHVHILENDGERIIKPIADLEAAGVRLVIDHLGRPDAANGLNCEGFKAVLRSVDEGQHLGEAVGRLPAAVARDREDVCDRAV